jgi:hypothetical protein
MKTYTEQLEILWEQMRATIIEKVDAIGTDSEVISGTKTIKLNIEEFYLEAEFKINDKIIIPYLWDNNKYNGQTATIINLFESMNRVQAVIVYNDEFETTVDDLYRKSSGLVSEIIKI